MVSFNQIQALSQQIVDRFQPERIILFGSYAYGQPSADSDVDLLVILPFEELPVQKAVQIRRQIHASFPLDLMVRTPEQVEQRLNVTNPRLKFGGLQTPRRMARGHCKP
jgi:uncharacterized protein